VAERERVVGTMVDSPSDAFGEGGLIFLTLSDFRHAPTFPRKSSHRGARETVGCRPDSASGGARVGYVLVAGQLRVLGGQGNASGSALSVFERRWKGPLHHDEHRADVQS
jgi:hypothetical protein